MSEASIRYSSIQMEKFGKQLKLVVTTEFTIEPGNPYKAINPVYKMELFRMIPFPYLVGDIEISDKEEVDPNKVASTMCFMLEKATKQVEKMMGGDAK